MNMSGEYPWDGWGWLVRFLVEGKDFRAVRWRCSSSTGAARAKVPVAHSHDAYEETATGLEGVLWPPPWTDSGARSGRVTILRPLRGAVHRFDRPPFTAPRRQVLAIVTPGILGPDYFREMASVVSGARRASPPGYGGGVGRE